jgi:cytochrome c oxidase cbb3-type subunit 3/ubiquinol-cytochrome c reductase cytochrome c subunit
MMLRRTLLGPFGRALAVVFLLSASALFLTTCAADAESHAGAVSAEVGAVTYAKTCALCHGSRGEGYVADNATALNNPTFLATASDEYLKRSVARGRPGTTMSAWDKPHGGPFEDPDIQGLVALMRSWQSVPTVALSSAPVAGDAGRGAPLYAAHCASCHGATGAEGPNVHLAGAELLAIASDEFLRYAIVEGRPGTTMAAYRGALQPAEIADVVALLRSWARPIAVGDVPVPGTMGPIILNPNGRDPSFVLGDRYTPADTIKQELDRGAAMGFLDARAPSDYVVSHVAGANNVPFYEGSQYLFALPKDKWLVTYCGCPHAESGQLADTLRAGGFTKVTVLDEGFYVWQNRRYPVKNGATP